MLMAKTIGKRPHPTAIRLNRLKAWPTGNSRRKKQKTFLFLVSNKKHATINLKRLLPRRTYAN